MWLKAIFSQPSPHSPFSPYLKLNPERKETRVLVVEPGSRVDDIRCQLKIISLSAWPTVAYETISYVWGDIAKRGKIFLSGREIDIPASSEAVLRRMRFYGKERVLWLDAISICQADNKERSQQVALMHEIYSYATSNLVWLGCIEGISDAANVLEAVIEEVKTETQYFTDLRVTNVDLQKGPIDLDVPDGSRRRLLRMDFHQMLIVFDSPWFSRVWVVQEAALARRNMCYCGETEIPLLDILRVACWIDINHRFLPPSVAYHPNIARAHTIWHYTDHIYGPYATRNDWVGRPNRDNVLNWRATIPPLFHRLKSFETTEPRDHVYALVGLYRKVSGRVDLPDFMVPDYDRPLSQVLQQLTAFLIKDTSSLACLDSLSHHRSDIDVASWV